MTKSPSPANYVSAILGLFPSGGIPQAQKETFKLAADSLTQQVDLGLGVGLPTDLLHRLSDLALAFNILAK